MRKVAVYFLNEERGREVVRRLRQDFGIIAGPRNFARYQGEYEADFPHALAVDCDSSRLNRRYRLVTLDELYAQREVRKQSAEPEPPRIEPRTEGSAREEAEENVAAFASVTEEPVEVTRRTARAGRRRR